MDASIAVAVLALVSSVGGVYIANRYTARTAREAQQKTAEIESKKLDVSSWQQQIDSWRQDAKELRESREIDRQRFESEQDRMRTRIDCLEEENVKNERELARVRIYADAITTWGRIVVMLLQTAGIEYPPMPPRIGDTDPGTTRSEKKD